MKCKTETLKMSKMLEIRNVFFLKKWKINYASEQLSGCCGEMSLPPPFNYHASVIKSIIILIT